MTQTAQTISKLDAATPIDRLEGITVNEIERLEAKGIRTIGHLWTRIGADKMKLTDLDIVAEETKISSTRLLELLPPSLINTLRTELLRRADYLNLDVPPQTTSEVVWDESKKSIWRQVALVLRKAEPWFRHHLLDCVVVLSIVGLVLLIFRAAGAFDDYPSPLGLRDRVVVTRRDLRAGEVLHVERDLSQARLPTKDTYFTSTAGLEGLILTRDVSSQKPLRSADLLRFQVIATKDINSGEQITPDAVTLAWSAYHPKALVRMDDATNRQSQYAIRKSTVILADAVPPKAP
jgi:hypothetical protein